MGAGMLAYEFFPLLSPFSTFFFHFITPALRFLSPIFFFIPGRVLFVVGWPMLPCFDQDSDVDRFMAASKVLGEETAERGA